MKANRPVTFKIKKGDLVKVISGSNKGKTGKVLEVHPRQAAVSVEGIGLLTRQLKPSQLNPKGGSKEIHRPIAVNKVAVIGKDEKPMRIGYEIKKDNTKVRVARNQGNKEIA